jgi:hypothetical protein
MWDAKRILDQYFPEMRWRCLSLAADLDRVELGGNGPNVLKTDPRLQELQRALEVLTASGGNRAERVLMVFSDTTPPPTR